MAQALQDKTKNAFNTPMMRQYLEIKSQHQDAILFYRLGDFYEMFFDDAVEASRLLDLTLTARNKNAEDAIPLCGVPYHSAESYIGKLVKSGKKVVVCEQTEDPKNAKGIVSREVTRVISPGLVTEEQGLSARQNNFLLCVVPLKNKLHCVICDVTTGAVEFFERNLATDLMDDLARLSVAEVVYPNSLRDSDLTKELGKHFNLYHQAYDGHYDDESYASDLLLNYYNVSSLASLGLQSDQAGVLRVLGFLFSYLRDNKLLTSHLLQQPIEHVLTDVMRLDENTIRHLELFKTMRDDRRHGTLLWHLDCCETVMGSRLLAARLSAPLTKPALIQERLDALEILLKASEIQKELKQILNGCADLERLSGRFALGSAGPRDAVALKDCLLRLPHFKEQLRLLNGKLFHQWAEDLPLFEELAELIQKTVIDEPPAILKDGGYICSGVSEELDELRGLESDGKNIIAKLEQKEKESTGITSLKIRYNNVFGYFIEVTHTHKDKVPAHYHRKQTLTNAERYITDELKNYESKVLGAAERIKVLEQALFADLRVQIGAQTASLKSAAKTLAEVDLLLAFTVVAQAYNYSRPKISASGVLSLKGARHPILERLNPGEPFVPNDVCLDQKNQNLMIITGPNMAGKSTIMRMTALITVMAQMGCYVPCEKAEVGVCDRIFTRVGAHDHLQQGLSTFMVEMVETAKILREASSRSLILLDEIGRGTSTFDGLSIAWAVAEDIHDRLGARTLFATHYHELCDLAEQKRGVHNAHMSVKEWNGQVIFLRKLQPGGTNRSYGVAVAAMSGLPESTVARAKEVLKLLELKDLSFQNEMGKSHSGQMMLFDEPDSVLRQTLQEIQPDQLTPIEALQKIYELKKLL